MSDTVDPKELCLALMTADSEAEVIELLKEAGYWDDVGLWRYYGDDELNWNRAGNQQARADFATNEKLVNAIDSRLMLECMLAGINPEDASAPPTMREAVNRFIEKSWTGTLKVSGGRVEEWPAAFRTQVAQGISVFVTGPKGLKPCVCIADLGEGQTPRAFPDTLLSLGKRNKFGVRFAQGKYGQGSSGALRFCGQRRLQLIVSRRHPKLLGNSAVRADYPKDVTDDQWGFTIVRREGEGLNLPFPFYSFLAPLDVKEKRKGHVLRFKADKMPIFPEGDVAFKRSESHGTLVKLYEYNLPNVSNILRRGGLRPRIDLLLPEPALPIRFHECREHQKSGNEQAETMSGLFARLHNNANLEELKPGAITLTVRGHEVIARIFAFKPDKSETYRGTEGVIFTINGQTQGYLKSSFFVRKKVGLQRLSKDLLVVLDCSSLTAMEQQDMFMPSRDRLVEDNPFAAELEKQLMHELREHQGLRQLKNARQKIEIEEQLADNKPLEDILKKVLKTSPALARLFGAGQRLHNPFKPQSVAPTDKPYHGRPHPTFFRFTGKGEGEMLVRSAHLESRVRITFETDVADDYFTRKVDPGTKEFVRIVGDKRVPLTDYSGPNLADGRASLTFDLPENAKSGDQIEMEFIVRDPIANAEFINRAKLTVLTAMEDKPKSKPSHKKPPGEKPGEQDGPSGIDLPDRFWIKTGDKNWGTYFSTPDDCLTVIDDGEEVDGKVRSDYKFYLNESNKALLAELATGAAPAVVVKKQFEVGMTLIGMAMLHDEKQASAGKGKVKEGGNEPKGESEPDDVMKRIQHFSRAIAPVLIPLIQSLGGLGDGEELTELVDEAA